MPIKPRKLERILQNKFHFTQSKEHKDHRWYILKLPNLPVITTQVSHSRKEIGKPLERIIIRQLRVRKGFYLGMVRCTNSRDDYYQKVNEDPHPPFETGF